MELTLQEAIKYVETLLNTFNYQKEERKIRTKYKERITELMKKYQSNRDKVLNRYQSIKKELTEKQMQIIQERNNYVCTTDDIVELERQLQIELNKNINFYFGYPPLYCLSDHDDIPDGTKEVLKNKNPLLYQKYIEAKEDIHQAYLNMSNELRQDNLKGYVTKKEEFDKLVQSYRPLVTEIIKEVENKYIKEFYEETKAKVEELSNEINRRKEIQKQNSLKIKKLSKIIEEYRVKIAKISTDEENFKREWKIKTNSIIKQNNLELTEELKELNDKYAHLTELKERIEEAFKISPEEWEEYFLNNDCGFSLQQLSVPTIDYFNGNDILKCHNIKIIVPNDIVNNLPNYFKVFDINDYYDLFMLDYGEKEKLAKGEFISTVLNSLIKDKEAIVVEDLLYTEEKNSSKSGNEPIEPIIINPSKLASFNVTCDGIKFQLNTPLFNEAIIGMAKVHYNKESNKKSKLLN